MTLVSPGWLTEVPLAHRGLCAGVARDEENSLEAFARSAGSGVGCELDVRLAADGVPVVVHDATVRSPEVRRSRVARLTSAELGRLGVPTLDAALTVLRERPVMVELKQPTPFVGVLEAAMLAVLAAHGRSRSDTVVASFNPWTLAWFARHAPSLPRALTVGRVATRTVLSSPVVRWVRPDALSVALAVAGRRRVRRMRRDLAVVCWTVKGSDELERVRSLVDNIIFEGAVGDLRIAA